MIFFILLFIQFAVFGALVVVLRSVLKRNMGSASNYIEILTKDTVAKLEEAKKKAEEADAHYDSVLAKSKDEGDKLKQQLIDEGVREKQDLIDQGRKQGEAIMEKAKTATDVLLNDMAQTIDQEALKKAQEAIKNLLAGNMAEETHARWVEDLLKAGFDGLDRLNIPEDVQEAKVVSAFPLKPAERNLLSERLKKKTGRTIHLNEAVDPALILGFKLMLANIVIDGSLEFKIQEILKNA